MMLKANDVSNSQVDWMPAERLGQASLDARLRAWLIGNGLLTTRLRAAAPAGFTLRLLDQSSGLLDAGLRQALRAEDRAGLFRDVAMGTGDQVWVFAQSVMPDSTLTAYPWLAELGEAALGETLAGLSGLERSSYEFAWLPAAHHLCARALQDTELRPEGLWARRSRLALRGAPILVQELFLPAILAA